MDEHLRGEHVPEPVVYPALFALRLNAGLGNILSDHVVPKERIGGSLVLVTRRAVGAREVLGRVLVELVARIFLLVAVVKACEAERKVFLETALAHVYEQSLGIESHAVEEQLGQLRR